MMISAFTFRAGFGLVTAGIALVNNDFQPPLDPNVSPVDTPLSGASFKRDTDTVWRSNATLDTSWEDTILFSVTEEIANESGNASIYASVEVICSTCYIKGLAIAQLTIKRGLNLTQEFNNLTSEIAENFGNFSTAAVNYIDMYIDNTTSKVAEDGLDIDDFEFPPIDIDFEIDIPDIPDCELGYHFDQMELYMQLDTILSAGATYTLNLYTSKTPIGFAITDNLLIGVVFMVDLILDVMSEIDVSSGFHIRLNDGINFKIPLFNQNVTSITFNGGEFEFLPVTMKNAGVIFTAILRIGVKAGLELSTPGGINDIAILKAANVKASTGIEAGVWIDIARFKTNITNLATPGDTCVRIIEEYVMALGANAGATLAIGNYAWGPELETDTPIYYTTLLDACAGTKTANGTIDATALDVRDDVVTTTLLTEVTNTATKCVSTGLVNCPASLQLISRNRVIKTVIATVTSGVTVTPMTVDSTVHTIAFGKNVHTMSATSGSPVSYISKQTHETKAGGSKVEAERNGGVSNKIKIGVSVGIGLPMLILFIAGLIYFLKNKRSIFKSHPRQ